MNLSPGWKRLIKISAIVAAVLMVLTMILPYLNFSF